MNHFLEDRTLMSRLSLDSFIEDLPKLSMIYPGGLLLLWPQSDKLFLTSMAPKYAVAIYHFKDPELGSWTEIKGRRWEEASCCIKLCIVQREGVTKDDLDLIIPRLVVTQDDIWNYYKTKTPKDNIISNSIYHTITGKRISTTLVNSIDETADRADCDNSGTVGFYDGTDSYLERIYATLNNSPSELFGTLLHELGHVLGVSTNMDIDIELYERWGYHLSKRRENREKGSELFAAWISYNMGIISGKYAYLKRINRADFDSNLRRFGDKLSDTVKFTGFNYAMQTIKDLKLDLPIRSDIKGTCNNYLKKIQLQQQK